MVMVEVNVIFFLIVSFCLLMFGELGVNEGKLLKVVLWVKEEFVIEDVLCEDMCFEVSLEGDLWIIYVLFVIIIGDGCLGWIDEMI